MPTESLDQLPGIEIGSLTIDADVTLRTLTARASAPQGTALLLHGFAETVLGWKQIASDLAKDYDVHAFEWPGYGRSTRPPVERFSYAPVAYAELLKAYIDKVGIDRSSLVIYATDISALPALLLALAEPDIAKSIIVTDFAPFNRPELMWDKLQGLKTPGMAEHVRAAMNAGRDEILANTFNRGLPVDAHYEVDAAFKADMRHCWDQGEMTVVDAFAHYYTSFTRDQEHFEANLDRITTPVKVLWGADDMFIRKEMGVELADRLQAEITLLPGVGHYAHHQAPQAAIDEIRAAFR